ncbi:hypothetical protein H5410_048290 [Solanum commersonii]|uniref:Cupin type-1 domain-containing protein n=1 Tax=Solanum commersonii TaxID=4109 RepID=A0A9J5XLE3_SOLCO|nr:hypothetical protein H5410_048290 [Solanum commersonii]
MKKSNNPYLFESHMFKSRFESKHGRGSVSIAEEDEKNSFNLEHGDVISVSAGSTIYFTNTDNKEKFSVYMLAKAVNVPGKFQEFFSAGSENPETFYRAFSNDILETAFNTPRNSQPGSRSIRGETRGPFNVLNQCPLIGNRFGQYFEAAPERFEHLRDLDVVVGNGRFEMVSSQSQQRRGHNYQKTVRGCLSVGDFFVIPAGHPITVIANDDSNFSMVGFGINGHNNMLNFLAGQENIWRNVNREAKELSFNMPAREVKEILQNQDESYFVAAPKEEGKKGDNNMSLQFWN